MGKMSMVNRVIFYFYLCEAFNDAYEVRLFKVPFSPYQRH